MNEQALIAAIGKMMDEKLEAGLRPIREDITEMKGEITEMKGQLTEIERRTTRLEVIFENDIKKALRLLAEGHENILETMERETASKEQLEKDEIRIFAIEGTVKQHSTQISDLQKKTG